ncbi:hypothetical protein L596_029841 [Steinernema carpocapsae]|uniref:Uncharacterized protein n=1 Tax=Steinernema carpocapsae TaxID=34508 RepID=A0A4U5LR00_STECR|nr:hypothetical protein L596_029841 [Steinernema carpocapsae]
MTKKAICSLLQMSAGGQCKSVANLNRSSNSVLPKNSKPPFLGSKCTQLCKRHANPNHSIFRTVKRAQRSISILGTTL